MVDITVHARRVLVVDDDEQVLPLLRKWAVRAGYEPVMAVDGRAALDAWDANPGIDAVVTDVRMPRVDGLALVTELRASRPDLPVVFISGFTGTDQPPHLAYQPFAAFVSKPFRFDELDAAMASVLDG